MSIIGANTTGSVDLDARPRAGIIKQGHRNGEFFPVTLAKLCAAPFVHWARIVHGRNRILAAGAALLAPLFGGTIGAVADRNLYSGHLNSVTSSTHNFASSANVAVSPSQLTDAGMLIKVIFTPQNGGPRKYALLQGEPNVVWTIGGERKMIMQASVVGSFDKAVQLVEAERAAAAAILNDKNTLNARASEFVPEFTSMNHYFKLGNLRQRDGNLWVDLVMDVKPKKKNYERSFDADLAASNIDRTQGGGRTFLAALGQLPEQKSQPDSPNANPSHFINAQQIAGIFGQEITSPQQAPMPMTATISLVPSANLMHVLPHHMFAAAGGLIGAAVGLSVLTGRIGARSR